MEFQPDGVVNLLVVLPDGSKEQYTWNKVLYTILLLLCHPIFKIDPLSVHFLLVFFCKPVFSAHTLLPSFSLNCVNCPRQ